MFRAEIFQIVDVGAPRTLCGRDSWIARRGKVISSLIILSSTPGISSIPETTSSDGSCCRISNVRNRHVHYPRKDDSPRHRTNI